MNAIISRGDKTAHVQLPVGRKQLSGALSYLGANHTSDYDLRYNEENKDGLKVSLECFGVVENAIAKALLVGFRFHTLNESLTLMGNLPYQNRREVENTIKVDGLDSYEQLNRMLTEAYPQSVTTKYYCPLTIQVHSRDCYGDIDEDGYEEDAAFAARHEDDIRQTLMEYNASDECNMAEYFHGNNGVSEKLRSADWDFERRNGELYGCITVQTALALVISIHTPAWGVTAANVRDRSDSTDFNPHPRVGGDPLPPSLVRPRTNFNPHPRVGGDPEWVAVPQTQLIFQSTPPRGG